MQHLVYMVLAASDVVLSIGGVGYDIPNKFVNHIRNNSHHFN